MSGNAPKQQTLDLSTLSVDNLSAVKKQLDDELEHLTNSFTKLRQAQSKFKECITSVKDGVHAGHMGKTLLVPLTTSLYVPATLSDPDHVLVDVGTGYYVEKSTEDAIAFYNGKVETIGKSLKDLEAVMNQKTGNVRIVEDVLRQKVLQAQSQGKQQEA